MIVTCVHINVKPEAIHEFIRISTENHLEAIKEPGNLRFDFVQQADDPCRFMLYEAYESEEAAAEHKSTPHYLKWKDAVQNLMAEPRKGVKYYILQPNDRTKW
ncbi:MAG: antibiotic biosynthesis monooxygenase [Bacteroidia bacterium]|nr:antibiotic biosynthesis monooxygenase [Bacteroidia bacterium]